MRLFSACKFGDGITDPYPVQETINAFNSSAKQLGISEGTQSTFLTAAYLLQTTPKACYAKMYPVIVTGAMILAMAGEDEVLQKNPRHVPLYPYVTFRELINRFSHHNRRGFANRRTLIKNIGEAAVKHELPFPGIPRRAFPRLETVLPLSIYHDKPASTCQIL